MAKTTYTRKQFAADLMEMTADGRLTLTDDQMECLTAWAESLAKKSAYKAVSKKAVENDALAVKLVDLMVAHADASVNAKFIADHLAGVDTPQKATAVANAAIKAGTVERYTDKGRTFYRLTR